VLLPLSAVGTRCGMYKKNRCGNILKLCTFVTSRLSNSLRPPLGDRAADITLRTIAIPENRFDTSVCCSVYAWSQFVQGYKQCVAYNSGHCFNTAYTFVGVHQYLLKLQVPVPTCIHIFRKADCRVEASFEG
jgi:hypothetical protein